MADEQQFIENGLQRTSIDEFFQDELGRAGYGGMDIAKTPMGTQIVLKAEKPGMVIGKGGKNIRKITTTLEEDFGLEDPQVDVQEVEEPDLNARIVADRLANALERGWYFRKAGHTTIDRIMESGALGAEIVLSGKVTGARSRVEKFNRGYIKHNGEPAEEIVGHGVATAVMKLGTIGVQVKIIPPGAELPDDFVVREDVEVEDYVGQGDGEGVEELLAEPDEESSEGDEEADVDDAGNGDAATPEEEPVEDVAEDEAEADVVEEEIKEDASQDAEVDEAPVDEEELEELDEAVEAELDEETEAEAEELMDEMEEDVDSEDSEEATEEAGSDDSEEAAEESDAEEADEAGDDADEAGDDADEAEDEVDEVDNETDEDDDDSGEDDDDSGEDDAESDGGEEE